MTAESLDSARLTLFVTGDAPRSRRARANLSDAIRRAGGDADAVCEVDLLRQPQQGLAYGIFATPALMLERRTGAPELLYGDLSDSERVQAFVAGWVVPA
jgi:circadian clock protein KaiB